MVGWMIVSEGGLEGHVVVPFPTDGPVRMEVYTALGMLGVVSA